MRDPSPLVTLPARQERPAFIAEAMRVMQMRCPCPTCVRLDKRYPGEGYQLALFPYVIQRSPTIRGGRGAVP
jgi:hypothetical protein